jgi:hypothetical protein
VKFGIQLSRSDVEGLLGRKLKHEDVVEAEINGQTFKSTVSMPGKTRKFGVLTSIGGRAVEHSISITE